MTMRFKGIAAALAAGALLAWTAPSSAATCPLVNTYVLRDGNLPQVMRNIWAIIKAYPDCSVIPASVPVDVNGLPVTGPPGPGNVPEHILATQDAANFAFQGAAAMTIGTVYAAGRSLAIWATAAGNVSVTFADSSTLTFPVQLGFQTLPFAVTEVNSETATATFVNLK